MKRKRTKPVAAIVSFTKEEFELLKQTAEDSDRLDDTYADWRANVDRTRAIMKAAGAETFELNVTVAEIEAYCRINGEKNTGATRAQLSQKLASGTLHRSALHGPK